MDLSYWDPLSLILVGMLMECLSLQSASGAEFGVEGYVVQEQYNLQTSSLRQTDRYSFRVIVTKGGYVIHTVKLTNLLTNEIAEITTGSDGLDTFSIDVLPEPAGNIVVAPGTVPRLGLVHEAVLWLAYCSAPYLDQHSDPKPLLVDYLLNEYSPSEVRYGIRRFDEPPRLPSELEVFSPKYSTEHGGSRPKRLPLPSPYEQGYRICSFDVSGYTNVNHCRIPIRFSVRNYVLNPGKPDRSNDLLLKCQLEFTAKQVLSDIGETDRMPALARSFPVYDYRFATQLGGEAIKYTATNSPLMPKDDPSVLQAIERKRNELAARGKKQRPMLILVLFVLLSVAPIYALVRNQRNSQNQPHKERSHL